VETILLPLLHRKKKKGEPPEKRRKISLPSHPWVGQMTFTIREKRQRRWAAAAGRYHPSKKYEREKRR